MKLNPYALLLTTGALMLATVVLAQVGTGVSLLKAGASSVDEDVSVFAGQIGSSLASALSSEARESSTIRDTTIRDTESARRVGALRVASVDRSTADAGEDHALAE